jgi:hypothetical protein
MMLASPNNTLVRDLVDNLPKYNRAWFFLPYVTVMFSTGCHYASYVALSPLSVSWMAGLTLRRTIFTLHKNRTPYRILSGTAEIPRMHMLNGYVDTPLFRHLGSSSWHSFDAVLINWLGHRTKGPLVVLIVVTSFVAGSLLAVCLAVRYRRRHAPIPNRNDKEI